jgi:hypothetical protein
MLAKRTTLDDLKRRIEALAPTRLPLAAQQLSTGDACLDRLFNGGLHLSKVSAWRGSPGAGVTSILRLLVRQTLRGGHRVVLIDVDGTLYAPDWFGMPHSEVLWRVRPRSLDEGVWAAEYLAASGALGLVVLSCIEQHPLQSRVASRLRVAAKQGHSAILVLASATSRQLNAALEVVVESTVGGLSEGRHTVRVTRTRGGSPDKAEVSFDIRERLIPDRMPQATLVADRRGLSRTRSLPSATSDMDRGAGKPRDGSLPLP